MGIFSRMRDIISANINAMLERAEDPEKMIRLMIQEMEDTLIEVKAQCAGVMAQVKSLDRQSAEMENKAADWQRKARLAVDKGREDLAREALLEKQRWEEQARGLQSQRIETQAVVERYQEDIVQLEEKIQSARDKQKTLCRRHEQAQSRFCVRSKIRQSENTDAFARFEGVERRVEQMESEADLVNYGRKPSLEEEFEKLEAEESLEKELQALKETAGQGGKG